MVKFMGFLCVDVKMKKGCDDEVNGLCPKFIAMCKNIIYFIQL